MWEVDWENWRCGILVLGQNKNNNLVKNWENFKQKTSCPKEWKI